MAKTAVVYQSKAGATKQYAQWLAEDVGADLFEAKKVSSSQLEPYDTIVFGGPIYVGKVSGASFLEKNKDFLKTKKLVFFVVGMSNYDDATFAKVVAAVFGDEYAQVPTFFCRGAWDESKMTFADRTMVKVLKKMLSKKQPEMFTEQDAALQGVIGTTQSWIDRSALDPVIAAVTE